MSWILNANISLPPALTHLICSLQFLKHGKQEVEGSTSIYGGGQLALKCRGFCQEWNVFFILDVVLWKLSSTKTLMQLEKERENNWIRKCILDDVILKK